MHNPGYLYYKNVEHNAGLQYYQKLLQNPGVKLYLSQHPELMTKMPVASTNPGLQVYQKYLDNEGLRWYVMQHADELKSIQMKMPSLPGVPTDMNKEGLQYANMQNGAVPYLLI
jgi:hypothetical protein